MKKENTFRILFWLVVLFLSLIINQKTFASHAQGADITYQCLGGNQYQVNVSFYRDCSGVAAPNSIDINSSSISCGQNFNTTIYPVAGTGIEVTPICNTQLTTCTGGSYPGVQEYIYSGVITLPTLCTDWTFSFNLCCRNNAINTINNPGGENIYVESTLNNLDFVCNNSPTFSNPPISFPCIGQTSCFNHGVTDADGDSLYYSLITPETGPATTVTYIAGYSAQQPLNSSPSVSFNSTTGDICMTPVQQEVTVLAVKVEEFRNEILVGSVIRDIQLRTVTCTNNLPYVTGIDGTGQFSITACAGSPINFTIPTDDPDPGQTLTITWNNAITAASFTDNGSQLPTGIFNWTPTVADISNNPYCFTVTVSDDNCPFNGVQIYSFCITVTGFTTNATSTSANCGASNGSASVTIQGGAPPYTYSWTPNGGNNANANGLLAGPYTVNVTDASGCVSFSTTVVGTGSLPGNINIASSNVSCYGGNDGSATANVNGGQQPYVYSWSNGGYNQTISNLTSGTYYVTVTSNGGCVTSDTVVITQPATPLIATTTQINPNCYNDSNGSATVTASGGTAPYNAIWNTNPVQNNLTANGLSSGTYNVLVTDNNGCNVSQSIIITTPLPLNLSLTNQQNVSCFNGNNGALSVNINGGTSPYSYDWNNFSYPNSPSITNLTAGNYLLRITDNNGCTDSNLYIITEPQPLSINLINQENIDCNGNNNGTISIYANGGTPPYSYNWNNNSYPNNYTISNLNSGAYSLIITDNNGCTETNQYVITEPQPLNISLINQQNIDCFGNNNGALSTNISGGVLPYSYNWNNNTYPNNSAISNLNAGNYLLIITDSNGCTESAQYTITTPQPLSFSVANQQNVSCYGESNGAISVNINGGTTPYSYNWNNNSYPNNSSINNLGAGVYLLNITDNNGCSANTQYTISEPAILVTSVLNYSDITCNGLNDGNIQTATTGGTPPYSYQWTPAVSISANATNLSSGNHVITVTDNNGCVDTSSAFINEPPALTTIALGGGTICPGQAINLSAQASGGTGNYIYQWNNGNNGATQMVSPSSSTTYSVYAIDANGCIGTTDSANVLVNDINLVNLSAVPDTTLCAGSPYLISANISGGIGFYSYSWDNGLGLGQGPFAVAPLITTNYTVTVTDVCGNSINEDVMVNVNPLPEVYLSPQSEIACGKVILDLNNNAANSSDAEFLWDFGDGTYSNQENPSKSYTQTGIYNVTLTVTTQFGCQNSSQANMNVTVNPQSVAQFEFTPEETDILNPEITFDNFSTEATYYFWNFGDDATSNELDPVHKYEEKGTYIITLITSNNFGCKDTLSKELLINPTYNFYIPNAFTPNNDGDNDIFTAVGEEIEEFNMQIFNRWGELIYETSDLQNGWDGTAKGGRDVSMESVYVYNIKLRDWQGLNHKFIGKVTLIK